jgi:hypothetical protein
MLLSYVVGIVALLWGLVTLVKLRGSAPIDVKRRFWKLSVIVTGILMFIFGGGPTAGFALFSGEALFFAGEALMIIAVCIFTYRRLSFCPSCGYPSFPGFRFSSTCPGCGSTLTDS